MVIWTILWFCDISNKNDWRMSDAGRFICKENFKEK